MTSLDVESNNNKPQEPREEIIKTAVKFLQNPQVSKSPLAKSQQFLRSKGLTDQEIQIACERSGAYNNFFNEKPILPAQQYYAPQPTLFIRIRDTLQSVALFSGFIYAIYLFYKRFIRRWLFGDQNKKTIEDSIEDLNKSVTESINDLRDDLTEVRTQVDRINGSNSTHMQLQDLKSEISSVKGLLLSRKQFPSVSSSSHVVPPSIPAWQLSSVGPGDALSPDMTVEKVAEGEDLLEVDSGSGASETEVATKNSDSSMEIM